MQGEILEGNLMHIVHKFVIKVIRRNFQGFQIFKKTSFFKYVFHARLH